MKGLERWHDYLTQIKLWKSAKTKEWREIMEKVPEDDWSQCLLYAAAIYSRKMIERIAKNLRKKEVDSMKNLVGKIQFIKKIDKT